MSSIPNATDEFPPLPTTDVYTVNVNQIYDTQDVFWSHTGHVLDQRHTTAIRIFSIFGAMVNLFVMAVCMTSKGLMSMRSTYLVISLSLADFLVCAGVMPLTNAMHHIPVQPIICSLWYAFASFACVTSSLNICAISIDRYVFITSPLRYDRKMSQTKLRLLLLAVWLTGAAVSALCFFLTYDVGIPFPWVRNFLHDHKDTRCAPNATTEWELQRNNCTGCHVYLGKEYNLSLIIFILFLPTIVIIVLYSRIYIVVRSQLKAIRRNAHRSFSTTAESPAPVPPAPRPSKLDLRPRSKSEIELRSIHRRSLSYEAAQFISDAFSSRNSFVFGQKVASNFSTKLDALASFITQEKKASFILGIVIGAYVLSWVPFGISVVLEVIYETPGNSKTRE
ncbi:hypothetical protein EGW08_018140, partial [Elysia chlorotica]